MLSDDINACFGKYLTSLSTPSDILNCEQRVKELSSLEEEVWKEKVSAEESHGEQFSNNGQIYTKRQTKIWKFGKYTLQAQWKQSFLVSYGKQKG